MAFDLTLTDDNGEGGRSCFHVLTKTAAAADFQNDGTTTCPDAAQSLTRLSLKETSVVKFAVVAGDGNSPAETAPITVRIGPKLTWEVVDGTTTPLALQIVAEGALEGFGGKVVVVQGGRTVATKAVPPSGVIAIPIRKSKRDRRRSALNPQAPTTVRYVAPSARWADVSGTVARLRRARSGALTTFG